MSDDAAFRLFVCAGAAALIFVALGICLLLGVTAALA